MPITRKEKGPARTGPRRIHYASPEFGFYFSWQYQPCRPPSTQIKRMIGNGMPMSQSNSPRPMTFSSVALFWTVRLTVNASDGSAPRFCARHDRGRTADPNRLGGGGGIRTHDTVSRIHAFQACAFSHSATPPDHGSERNITARVRVTTLLVAVCARPGRFLHRC
jgi:hypothetical protein